MNDNTGVIERWPPAYDAEDLGRQIKDLVARGDLFKSFFWAKPKDVPWCQGDIVQLGTDFPFIDADGQPAVLEDLGIEYWLLLSNTCDLHRPLENVRFANLAPIFDIPVTNDDLAELRSYAYSRKFYVPDWTSAGRHFVADLTMPVTISREAFVTKISRVSRLSQIAWVLLHSCLIRYLARDDGRFD